MQSGNVIQVSYKDNTTGVTHNLSIMRVNDPSVLPDSELALLPAHLDGRAQTIFGGSSEIQHEIIAKQMLGL